MVETTLTLVETLELFPSTTERQKKKQHLLEHIIPHYTEAVRYYSDTKTCLFNEATVLMG